MNGEITGAVLEGTRVSVMADNFPCTAGAKHILVSMTKQTWNGMVTLNRKLHVGAAPEQMDAAIVQTVKEMAGTIELPHNWKG